LSTKSEKTYISVQEFVSSWEKEIYELTNLDYFIFLLINHIGYQIEHNYFSTLKPSDYLRVDPEEIGTLAFNLGDSLESFVENNCFGDCTLACPTHLDDQVEQDELKTRNDQLQLIQLVNGTDYDKRSFFINDILNYVVIDTLFDFYQYEIGLNLDDTDLSLIQFADFLTSILEKFIENQGQNLLSNPRESSTELFNKLMYEANPGWDEEWLSAMEEEGDESEMWKYGNLYIQEVVADFLREAKENEKETAVNKKLLEYFKEYTDTYADLKRIDELEVEDLEEFFLFWLVREITFDLELTPDAIRHCFHKFFKWLEIYREVNLYEPFESLMNKHFTSIQNVLLCSRNYFTNNSLVDGIIQSNTCGDQIVSGLFEIEKISRSGLIQVSDIHFNKKYLNVQHNFSGPIKLMVRSILSATLKPTAYGWRFVSIDYIFPQAAKPYLR
jgi:hypothetical protein